MSTYQMPEPPALPIASTVLRILVILNWVGGAAILVLLVALPNADWIMQAFKLSPSPDTDRLILGLRTVAALGLVAIVLNHVILRRLEAMVGTVRAGDPFVADNASRLQTIARCLLGLQVLSMIIGGIGRLITSPAHPVDFDAGFSLNGWLAVLMTFILARVFEEGTRLRDDVQGTV